MYVLTRLSVRLAFSFFLPTVHHGPYSRLSLRLTLKRLCSLRRLIFGWGVGSGKLGLNLGAPGAAAEHLLAAIAVQRNTVIGHAPRDHDVPSGATLTDAQESPNLWSTLRRIFTSMDRMDLANKARPGASLDDFKKQLEA